MISAVVSELMIYMNFVIMTIIQVTVDEDLSCKLTDIVCFSLQASVSNLLHLLGLDEYFETLTRQGYLTIDSLLDITWEDLEEVGIRKLGSITHRLPSQIDCCYCETSCLSA